METVPAAATVTETPSNLNAVTTEDLTVKELARIVVDAQQLGLGAKEEGEEDGCGSEFLDEYLEEEASKSCLSITESVPSSPRELSPTPECPDDDLDESSDHNYLQAANTLPVEILTFIFSLLQKKSITDPNAFPPPNTLELRGFHSWMSVTQVCRYWRKCAVDTPTLWRYIAVGEDVSCPGSLGMLHLSRSYPCTFTLNIACKASHSDNMRTLLKMYQFYDELEKTRNRSRIGGIHVATYDVIPEVLRLMTKVKLPALTSVHVCDSALGVTEDRMGGNYDLFNRDVLPAIYTHKSQLQLKSNLKRLSLIGVRTLPPAGGLSGLTHLNITQHPASGGMSPQALLKLLSSCPNLESLRFKDIIEESPFTDFHKTCRLGSNACVSLPHLKFIYIVLSHSKYAPHILHHISFPSDARVMWVCRKQIFELSFAKGEPYRRLQLPPAPHLETVTTLGIRDSYEDHAMLFKDTLIWDTVFPRVNLTPHDNALYTSNNGLSSLLPNIKTLVVDMGSTAHQPQDLFAKSLFKHCKKLTEIYLKIEEKCLASFLQWLSLLDCAPEGDSKPLLPNLSMLLVHVIGIQVSPKPYEETSKSDGNADVSCESDIGSIQDSEEPLLNKVTKGNKLSFHENIMQKLFSSTDSIEEVGPHRIVQTRQRALSLAGTSYTLQLEWGNEGSDLPQTKFPSHIFDVQQ